MKLTRPSPALIVATLALIVALGGTSYAAFKIPSNSVGTKQLKKKAVGTKQLKASAVGSKQLKLDSVGVDQLGPASVDTAAILDAAVTKAKIDPAALQNSTVVRTFLANFSGNGTLGEAESSCNAGEVLVGGGGGWVNNAIPATTYQLSGTVSDSGPSQGGDTPSVDGTAPLAWHVSGRNTTGANARMLAYAVCLS